MDTPFFREIKPYNRGGNNIKNTKRTYYLIIKFICRITNFKIVSIKYNKLTHGVYSEKISPFINPFLYTNPGFFKPLSSIIINLGHPISVILVNRISSAGLRRRVMGRRVISVIGKKKRKACQGKRCIIIYKLGG